MSQRAVDLPSARNGCTQARHGRETAGMHAVAGGGKHSFTNIGAGIDPDADAGASPSPIDC